MTSARRHLRNISEIRSFFRTNDEPIYFVGPTVSTCSGSIAGCGTSTTSPTTTPGTAPTRG